MVPEFIFMLTVNDRTVSNALDCLERIGDARVPVVGFKDIGLPMEELRLLADAIRASGRRCALEVVSLDAVSEMQSARAAVELGVDYLLGGTRAEDVTRIIANSGIRYFPFCGVVVDHPSRLCGSIEEIAESAERLTQIDGVDGVDLLAYRWQGDVEALTKTVVKVARGGVIAAGDIDRSERISVLARAGIVGFTVGTAVFKGNFSMATRDLRQQVESIQEINREVSMDITREMIVSAAERISGKVRNTPVMRADPVVAPAGAEIFLKLESLQHSGSFKARGAFNTLLSVDIPETGVIAASGGNHGAAVAYACQQLGIPVEIFVPEIASPVKLRRLREYGAQVHVIPGSYADALEASERQRARSGARSIHAYDAASVVAGQGTTGHEMSEQLAGLDTVIVAVGGGGLIGGIASWFRGDVKVIGVEPSTCRSLTAALEAGQPVDVDVRGLAADALGARRIGEIGYGAASKYVDHTITLEDEDIAAAQLLFWNEFRIAVEPAGAAALAPLLTGQYVPQPGERVCVLVCGGNADLAKLAAA